MSFSIIGPILPILVAVSPSYILPHLCHCIDYNTRERERERERPTTLLQLKYKQQSDITIYVPAAGIALSSDLSTN